MAHAKAGGKAFFYELVFVDVVRSGDPGWPLTAETEPSFQEFGGLEPHFDVSNIAAL
jgi:hypothetical protein